jgi:prepilin-type N-terminal cleavage/methylation domain-containing protein
MSVSRVYNRGFTLIELLIAIAIIGILATVVISRLGPARDGAFAARAQIEFNQFKNALKQYQIDTGTVPPDVNRDLPPEIDGYLQSENWSSGPWPNSVYDWDNWTIGGDTVQQLSIRFCPDGGPIEDCSFPGAEWSENFMIDSAVFYCFEGPCRSHENRPRDYPGRCMNCECKNMAACHGGD